jgi:hypothetical protein
MRCCRISASTLVLSSAGLVLSADTVRWSFTVIERVARVGRSPVGPVSRTGGAAGFLAKPFTMPEFIATLDRFLAPPAG